MRIYYVSQSRESWGDGAPYLTLAEAVAAREGDEFIHEVTYEFDDAELVEAAFGESVLPEKAPQEGREWCEDNDCERPECARCFPHGGDD